ncbi:hypothetical protein BKA63DRAFT_106173 [Paraphoma chrysanthemicola]|nr:hypothetical protein BKA63DRAFT_106173 [Paraphoma chrysanthemicola]
MKEVENFDSDAFLASTAVSAVPTAAIHKPSVEEMIALLKRNEANSSNQYQNEHFREVDEETGEDESDVVEDEYDAYDNDDDDDDPDDDSNSVSEEEEEPPKEAAFKTQLQACLDDVKYQGTFLSSTTTGLYINPALHITKVGTVGLPLSTRDAQAIAAVCKQSPFGKGDETVVDENVRKTWELDNIEFSCRNPAWGAYVDKLAQQAIQNLGVQVPATAQSYKLLLYEEGAFFKAHRDTEKVPGMFGTLIVCLPSLHTGGEVRLVHNGKERTISTASTSAFELTALAWYSDVQHEIMPVTSGYRLVLTYNLVQNQMYPKQTAAALDTTAANLGQLLRTWDQHFPWLESFIYPLEHRYTENSLSLRNLKGQDAAKCRYLEQLCSKHGVYWYLAQMTKEEEDDYYSDGDGENNGIFLKTPTMPSGALINLGLKVANEKDILADMDDLYGDRNADSEDEGEYTGNENMPSSFRYHNTVAIMSRKDKVIREFGLQTQHPSGLETMFQIIESDKQLEPIRRREAMEMLLRKSIAMVTYNDEQAWPSKWDMSKYIEGHNGPGREAKREQYAKVFATVSDYCYANNMAGVVAKLLQESIQDKHWIDSQRLVGLVARHVSRETADGKEDVWSSWLSAPLPLVPTYKYANERRKTFEVVQKILPSTFSASFTDWREKQLDLLLRSITSFTMEDAEPVIELILVIPSQTYFEVILPNMLANPHAAGLSRFVHRLGRSAAQDSDLEKTIEVRSLKQLLPKLAQVFKLSATELTTQPYQLPPYQSPSYQLPYSRNTSHVPPELSTSAIEFTENIQHCMVLGLKSETVAVVAAGLPELPAPQEAFWDDWQKLFIFVKSLIDVAGRFRDTELNKPVAAFITKALQSAAIHLAHLRPQEPRDWARPCAPYCHCGPCVKVHAFLLNPTQQRARYSYADRTRIHMQSKLNHDDFNFHTERRTTLVIQKTNNQYLRDLQKWKSDLAELRTKMTGMQSMFVTELLGGDILMVSQFDDALRAAGAADGIIASASQPLHSMSSSAQNAARPPQVAGFKRKAEVIDLTEDGSF